AVADLQVLDRAAELHDLAHELVAEDVAALHRRHEAVVEVEIRAADRRRGDPHDRVARVEDPRVRDLLDADLALAHPEVGLHGDTPLTAVGGLSTSTRGGRISRGAGDGCAGWGRRCTLASERSTSPVSSTCLSRRRSPLTWGLANSRASS